MDNTKLTFSSVYFDNPEETLKFLMNGTKVYHRIKEVFNQIEKNPVSIKGFESQYQDYIKECTAKLRTFKIGYIKGQLINMLKSRGDLEVVETPEESYDHVINYNWDVDSADHESIIFNSLEEISNKISTLKYDFKFKELPPVVKYSIFVEFKEGETSLETILHLKVKDRLSPEIFDIANLSEKIINDLNSIKDGLLTNKDLYIDTLSNIACVAEKLKKVFIENFKNDE